VTIQITAERATALADRDHPCLRDHLKGSSLLIVDIGTASASGSDTPRGNATVATSDVM
jgi:hypothetical protein